MSTHYIVAAYLGPRRIEDPRQVADRLFFLREHFASLARLAHRLSRITLVLSFDDASQEGDALFKQHVDEIVPGHVNIVRHKNDIGLSYSAMRAAVLSNYDYTIFNEDDYIFAVDHFDRFLVDQLSARADVSLLCGCACDYLGYVAAVATGIMRTAALDFQAAAVTHTMPQRLWSAELARHGLLADWLHHYATAYWQDGFGVTWFERPRDQRLGLATDTSPLIIEPKEFRAAMVVPVQAMDRDVKVFHHSKTDGAVRFEGRLDRNGRIFNWNNAS